MHIKYLKLQNFRSYKDLELFFSPKINVFWGKNGQGKTNLLEAIYLLSTGRSFRTHRLQDMIQEGKTYFYIEGHFIKEEVSHSVKIYYDSVSKKVIYNDTPYSQFSSLLGLLPSVLLSPDDLSLINGSPEDRRRFLDLHIAQMDPLYLFYLGRYYKAMKQRNALLRSKKIETIDIWEKIMLPAAVYLITKRKQATALLQKSCLEWMHLFSFDEELLLSYSCFEQNMRENEMENQLILLWQSMRRKEMQYGTTLSGPHRDDLCIKHCGKQAKYFASEGQKRCCIISLRFAQWDFLKKNLNSSPLLAIDDFAVQLDAHRQEYLKEHIFHFGQVFLTSPQPVFPLEDTSFQTFHIQKE